jgi:hypothetical protein
LQKYIVKMGRTHHLTLLSWPQLAIVVGMGFVEVAALDHFWKLGFLHKVKGVN